MPQARAVDGVFRLRALSYEGIDRIIVGQAVVQISQTGKRIRVFVIGDLTVASTYTEQDWKDLLGKNLGARTWARVVPLYSGASLLDGGMERAKSDSETVAAMLDAAIQAEINKIAMA